MKKISYLILSISLLFIGTSCELLEIAGDELSSEEVTEGLKTALEVGTDTAVTVLNAPGGYFKDEAVKILLPEQAQPAIDLASNYTALQPVIDLVLEGLNRTAEDAASQAKPIFVDAIVNMSIADAFEILNGGSTAATDYLKAQTYGDLQHAFADDINNSLGKPLVNNYSAVQLWSQLANGYNLATILTGGQLIDPNLGEYVTGKALDGLFLKISIQESKIRENPSDWALSAVGGLLDKVFGSAG